ncbi:hypothetical protein ACROYT_G023678 [Oculina patagonica]
MLHHDEYSLIEKLRFVVLLLTSSTKFVRGREKDTRRDGVTGEGQGSESRKKRRTNQNTTVKKETNTSERASTHPEACPKRKRTPQERRTAWPSERRNTKPRGPHTTKVTRQTHTEPARKPEDKCQATTTNPAQTEKHTRSPSRRHAGERREGGGRPAGGRGGGETGARRGGGAEAAGPAHRETEGRNDTEENTRGTGRVGPRGRRRRPTGRRTRAPPPQGRADEAESESRRRRDDGRGRRVPRTGDAGTRTRAANAHTECQRRQRGRRRQATVNERDDRGRAPTESSHEANKRCEETKQKFF